MAGILSRPQCVKCCNFGMLPRWNCVVGGQCHCCQYNCCSCVHSISQLDFCSTGVPSTHHVLVMQYGVLEWWHQAITCTALTYCQRYSVAFAWAIYQGVFMNLIPLHVFWESSALFDFINVKAIWQTTSLQEEPLMQKDPHAISSYYQIESWSFSLRMHDQHILKFHCALTTH